MVKLPSEENIINFWEIETTIQMPKLDEYGKTIDYVSN